MGSDLTASVMTSCKVPLYIILLLAAFLSGCVSSLSVAVQSPFNNGEEITQELQRRSQTVLREITERNRVVEKNPAWIQEAYKDFMIRNLADVSATDYPGYSRYLSDRSLYILVHPAYYTFFSDDESLEDDDERRDGMTGPNALERFLESPVYSNKRRIMKAQEKMMRDFLEFVSTEKKLVVLILPGHYRNYAGYRYRKSNDEYMRFINEVTNASDSVLYLYSKKANKGTLGEKERELLLKFINEVKADSVLLGGGYVGRCLEDTYKSLEPYISEDRIFMVPELAAMSPSDIEPDLASYILRGDGTLDIKRLSYCLTINATGNQEITPLIKNLSDIGRTP